jgi:anti-anti-sigma factor
MNIIAEALDGALVVRLDEERLDAAIAIQFKDRMREITAQPAERVVLDLSSVAFVDSSGLVVRHLSHEPGQRGPQRAAHGRLVGGEDRVKPAWRRLRRHFGFRLPVAGAITQHAGSALPGRRRGS